MKVIELLKNEQLQDMCKAYWEHRYSFMGEKTNFKIDLIYNFYKNLDFNCNYRDEFYRIGLRNFNYKANIFDYTQPNVIETNYYTTIIHSLRKHINDDLFVAKKKKIGITSKKLPNNIDFKTFTKNDLLNYKLNFKGIIHTFAIKRKENTNILVIDIDSRESTENNFKTTNLIVNKLCKILKVKLNDFLFIEQNVLKGNGIHCYIRCPKNMTEENLKNLENYIAIKLGFRIEINFFNKLIRPPFSYEYLPIDLRKFKKYFYNFDKNNLNNYFKTLEEAINYTYLKLNKFDLGIRNCEFFDKQLYITDNLNIYLKTHCKKKIDRHSEINFKETNKKLFIQEEKTYNLNNFNYLDKPIVKGHSLEAILHRVPWAVARGIDEDTVVKRLFNANVNGEKFINNPITTELDIRKFYKKCSATILPKTKTFVPTKATKWTSNYQLAFDEYGKDFFENNKLGLALYNKLYKYCYKTRKLDGRNMIQTCKALCNEKYKLQLIKSLPIYLKEIIGNWLWTLKVGRKSIYSKKHESLFGVQLPISKMKMLQTFVNESIGIDTPHYFDPKQFRVILLKIFGLEEKTHGMNFNYIHGSCKYWGKNNNSINLFEQFINFIKDEIKTFIKKFNDILNNFENSYKELKKHFTLFDVEIIHRIILPDKRNILKLEI